VTILEEGFETVAIISTLQIRQEAVGFAIAVPEFVLSKRQQYIHGAFISGNGPASVCADSPLCKDKHVCSIPK